MAKKFVSLEAAERAICKACKRPGCPKLWGHGCKILDRLTPTPAADAVEVVRCKDCYAYRKDTETAKAANLDPGQYCALLRCEFGPDGFCAYGRRTDNEL